MAEGVTAPRGRVVAIDAARGLAVALMLLVERLAPTPAAHRERYTQWRHEPWSGLHVADVVFPAFLVVVGVGMAWSLARPVPVRDRAVRLGRRVVALLVLGLLFNAWAGTDPTDLGTLRIMGVLQRIALAGFLGTIVVLACRRRLAVVLVATAVVLVGYGLVLDHVTPSCAHHATLATPDCSLPGQVDVRLWGASHVYHGGTLGPDPEGLLSTLGATGSVLLGWCVGDVLRRDRRWSTLGALAAAAGAAAVVALVWGMPVIKRVWTPTFVLVTGALTVAGLVALIALTDADDERPEQWRRAGRVLSWPMVVLGRNALLVYLVQHFVGTALDDTTVHHGGHTTTATARLVDALAGGSPLTLAVLWVLAMVAVAAVLHALDWHVTV
jgi:predicted acyltransferase